MYTHKHAQTHTHAYTRVHLYLHRFNSFFFQRKKEKKIRLVCCARAHAGALSHRVAKVAGREHPLHALLCLALSPSPCVLNPKPIDTHARVHARVC